MAQHNRLRIPPVLATDAGLDIRSPGPGFVESELHELADAAAVDRGERVVLQDSLCQIVDKESALGVIPADPERHLGQVVGTE